MALTVTTITGKIYEPSGAVAPGAKIRIYLSEIGRAEDGAGTQMLMTSAVLVIADSSGDVSFSLVANTNITPSGTNYRMDYETPGGSRWTDRVTVPASGPVEIGDLPAA